MILDLAVTRVLPAAAPDTVLVVGSGAAGLALAGRLSATGRPVLLLESGVDLTSADYDPTAPDDRNAGISTGLRYAGLTEGRSRNLGGSTQLWHGQCMRLHEIDLADRGWIAHSGWPIALADLAAYYDSAERWLGVTGLGYGAQRWQEHPQLPPLQWDPAHLLHDFTEYTPRPYLGRVHRAELLKDPNLQVLVNATVSAVTTEAARLTGVEVIAADGARLQLPASTVVLAAGTIENARILQLSDPEGVGLGTGRALTGRFLQDHPIIRTAEVLSFDHRVLQDRYVALHRGDRRLFPKVRLSEQAQQRAGLVDATAVFVHDHDEPSLAAARRLLVAARTRRRPDQPVRDTLRALGAPAPLVRDTYRRYRHGLSTGARPTNVWLQIWLEQVPDPDSRVTLSDATDRLGLRRTQVNWKVSDQELDTSRQLTRWIGEDLARLGIAQVRELAPMTDDDAWRAAVTDASHPAGTTRMAPSPDLGVVDTDLQVHGVPGLFAVGGSVFPTSGYANPTLTIVALALRLADRLSSRGATAR